MASVMSTAGMPATLALDEAAALRRKMQFTKALGVTIAVTLLIVAWQVLAFYNKPWVPAPTETLLAMWKALHTEQLYIDMWLTWQRLLAAFLASSIIGIVLGIAVGLNRRVEAFCQPLLALALAVPDPVYIIFAVLAFGTGELAGFIALTLAVMPFVVNVIRTSIHARDRTLDEMTKVYRLSSRSAFWNSLVPQMVPSLITASRFSFALSWKIVILVEALTQPHGIGANIYHSFSVLKMRDAIAVAIIFCVIMQLAERLVLVNLEKRLLRWRD